MTREVPVTRFAQQQRCSKHGDYSGEGCPGCRAESPSGHYETQLQLARLQEENRKLRSLVEAAHRLNIDWEAMVDEILGREGVRDREASRA